MRNPRFGYTRDGIETNDSGSTVQQYARKLATPHCEPGERHCATPKELDVESPPVATSIPTFSPTVSPMEVLEAATKAPTMFAQSQPTPGSSIDVPTKNPLMYYFGVTTRAPTLAPSNLETRNPNNYPAYYATDNPTFQSTRFNINENLSERTETPTTTLANVAPNQAGALVAPTVSPISPGTTRRPTFLTGSMPTPLPISVPTKLPTPLSTSSPALTPSVTIPATSTSASPDASELGVTPNSAPGESTIEPTKQNTAAPSQFYTSTGSQSFNQSITPTSQSRPTMPAATPIVVTASQSPNQPIAPTSQSRPTVSAATPTAATASQSPNQPIAPTSQSRPTVPAATPTAATASQSPTQPIAPTSQSRPTVPAATPTVKPPSSTATSCVADSKGGFGVTERVYSNTGNSQVATNVRFVEYRYQVETTPKFEVTKDDLNSGILRNVERSISDVLVASFFPPNEGYLCDPYGDNDSVTPQVLRAMSNIRDGSTKTPMGNNETSRANAIVGLTADPPDLVPSGTEAVSCPYPLQVEGAEEDMDGPACYVIDGELSIFMGSTFDSTDDLSWVDSMVRDEIELAMNTGELDNVDPVISFVRYIPLESNAISMEDINGHPSENEAATEEVPRDDALSSAPTWSWILAGFGFFGLGIVVFVMTIYRRRRVRGEGSNFDSAARNSTGAFPVPVEIVDDNSEFDNEIYKDDDEEDEKAYVVRQPADWRQVNGLQVEGDSEFLRLEINATDPNQPVVRPVLDEESETFINNV